MVLEIQTEFERQGSPHRAPRTWDNNTMGSAPGVNGDQGMHAGRQRCPVNFLSKPIYAPLNVSLTDQAELRDAP
jgi:hypothetical protein